MSSWAGLFAGAAATAVIELDAVSLGQLMISRPIVLGPAMGAVLGEPAVGAGLGVLCELFNIEELPVGGNIPLNATVAVSVALLLAFGSSPVPLEIALPAGLATGWGHSRVEGSLRRWRGDLNAVVEGRLSQGYKTGIGRLAARELFKQAAVTFTIVLLSLLCRGPLRSCWMFAPEAVRSGLRLGLIVSPWVGLWALMRSFKVVS